MTHTVDMNQAFFRATAITQVTRGINIVAPRQHHGSVGSLHALPFTQRRSVRRQDCPGRAADEDEPCPHARIDHTLERGGRRPGVHPHGERHRAWSSQSKVRWNGTDRTTTFVSATQLSAAIPAADIATAGSAQVTVFSPAPGGGTSAARAFHYQSSAE